MKACRLCLLPEQAPGADLDANGVCRFCREHAPASGEAAEALRRAREADLERAIEACRGRGEYDCLVPLSGGKDSVALIHKLKVEYGLRVLAHTTDIDIGEVAWANIRRAVDRLDVEHLVYRPQAEFYRRLFRWLMMNQEARGAVHTISYVYAPLFEGNALRVATDKGIPLVLAGYSPGQPVPERMEYEFPRLAISEVDWTPPELAASGEFDAADLARFWNPRRYPPGTVFPRYLAPYHAWRYDQEAIMKKVVELGLISSTKNASPVFSNYPINWLLMYSDLRNFGYNPYTPEFSALIREGKANLRYWRVMAKVVDFITLNKVYLGRHVAQHMRWLNLRDEDLKITRPSRRDWPDFVYEDWAQAAPGAELIAAAAPSAGR
ncbi:adenine nucleotide alpha hydrolase family protein [Rubrivivax gelatinosus]|uniref:N-acetyl sugar amidotransferase n=1 Tax=Rubrivivax gelatinosus (strain NBRC 100245 / IL144) TaxID=983917 RepID=I0HL16_RUBGI|nr:hypothetical protein [Rubrivivax gelatinosus]BAL93703.1 hypothetical protein RGE_03580 [Rubrivivax gelatinosus IL144]